MTRGHSAASRPNVVFILADDLGWCDLGVEGSRFYESPHLDGLAGGGMRFTQGYAACQVCSPSRASILTGKYPPRHGVTDWIGAPAGAAWRELGRHSKLLPPEYEHSLRANEITFAEVFRRAGYRTFFAGKWHLGDTGADPEEFGFEINKGGWRVGTPMGGYFAPWDNPKLEPGPAGESLPLRLGRETVRFIGDHREQPFLAYLSFYSVHGPIQTSRERWERFRAKAAAQGTAQRRQRFRFDGSRPVRLLEDCPVYAGMIEAMDEAVGLVLDALDRFGLADNTIVCFTSDNGGASTGDAFSASMLPLRGGKGRQWEGGIREPLHVRHPELVASGTTCDVPVSGIDFYPTLLELAGLELPPEQVIDGRSMVPLLRGRHDPAISERDLFWHYPHYGNQGGDPSSMVRNGPWKLIHYHEDGHNELYHLEADPGERHDVLNDQRATAGDLWLRLQADPGERHDVLNDQRATAGDLWLRLQCWLDETGAKFPAPDPQYDAAGERAFLHHFEHERMPELEALHAAYLDPHWQPNADWWGSQIVAD